MKAEGVHRQASGSLSRITTKITEPEPVIIVYKFHTQDRLRVHRIVIRRLLRLIQATMVHLGRRDFNSQMARCEKLQPVKINRRPDQFPPNREEPVLDSD